MKDHNWEIIRKEYITTNTSYRKIAAKYGLSYGTVAGKGKKENWQQLRDQKRIKTISKTIEKASEIDSIRAVSIDHVAELILQGIERDVLSILDKGISVNWKGLTGALRDIKELKISERNDDLSVRIVFDNLDEWTQ